MQLSTQTVRRASLQDVDLILRLARRFVAVTPFARVLRTDDACLRAGLLALLDTGAVFVLEDGERIVGALVATLTQTWVSPSPVACELGWWVSEEARGRGTLLLDAFESWAADCGAEACILSDLVHNGQTPAGTLYERHGYECMERAHIKALGGF